MEGQKAKPKRISKKLVGAKAAAAARKEGNKIHAQRSRYRRSLHEHLTKEYGHMLWEQLTKAHETINTLKKRVQELEAEKTSS